MNERIIKRIRKRIEFLKLVNPPTGDEADLKNQGAIEELELLLVFLFGARSKSQVRRLRFQEGARQ